MNYYLTLSIDGFSNFASQTLQLNDMRKGLEEDFHHKKKIMQKAYMENNRTLVLNFFHKGKLTMKRLKKNMIMRNMLKKPKLFLKSNIFNTIQPMIFTLRILQLVKASSQIIELFHITGRE